MLHVDVQLLEEEDSADEEFWGQEFFQEEKQDDEYTSESSEESVADSDFSASVGAPPLLLADLDCPWVWCSPSLWPLTHARLPSNHAGGQQR